jgi:hypothetical protein
MPKTLPFHLPSLVYGRKSLPKKLKMAPAKYLPHVKAIKLSTRTNFGGCSEDVS